MNDGGMIKLTKTKNGNKQTLQSFFTKVAIKYSNSEFIKDIPNFKILYGRFRNFT